jgi:XTP/dITP diphosphohydrolase
VNVLHLATGNAHKVREFQILADAAGLALRMVPAANMPAVVEDTGTFVGNARKKAAALKAMLPPDAWVLADDSGVCVDALGGEPGVESAYFAGPAGDSRANLKKLVDVMRGVPEDKRSARFICVLVLLGPRDTEVTVEGRCEGTLRREPAGDGGFGYDPLFTPAGSERCYAELSEAEKNQISHRARAFRALIARLPGLQGKVE